VSALQVLYALRASGLTLELAAGGLNMYPQTLINVRVRKGFNCFSHHQVIEAVAEAERALDGKGRVLLRPSGTEPVLRVMVEGEDRALVVQSAQQIAEVVRQLSDAAGIIN
jgi:phosphoglucosamine mutase